MADAASAGSNARGRAERALLALHQRQVVWVRNSGMAGLLALLAFGMFVLPAVFNVGAEWHLISDVLMTLMLLFGIAAVVEHRRIATTLIVLAVVVIAIRWSEWVLPVGVLPVVREASTLVALLVLATAVGINVFARKRDLSDRIFGAIVLYLLISLMFAVTYAMIAGAVAGAFAGKAMAVDNLFDWGYFSLVTLTTVGYGDVTPVARIARSLATLEALIGQLYPAVIIARLLSVQGD
jgi:hypothetical protein